jgi:hypothetical protein
MFSSLKKNVQDQLAKLSKHQLFKVDLDRDILFDTYLEAIPLEERQHYTCNCCKSFLRNYGDIIAIIDGEIHTLWDFEFQAPYDKIPTNLRDIVLSASIKEHFQSDTHKIGTDFNHQNVDGTIIKWEHFYCQLPSTFKKTKLKDIPTVVGQLTTDKQVFKRALDELSLEAGETILELIDANALYRGTEYKHTVAEFIKHKKAYLQLDEKGQELYAWAQSNSAPRIRNTAIGALLIDLSDGRDLESAVKSFENMVAPANYKRPTALITKGMIEQAESKIKELGLDRSLKRRFATIDDIPVSHAIFVDRKKKSESIFDELKQDVKVNPKSFKNVQEVSFDDFVGKVLPTANTVEILPESKHENHFMSLLAADDKEAPLLFNWDNDVSWAYKDNMTDSVKAKVKQAGGTVEGELRISLEWFNYDDLDLHVIEPNGHKIYFGNRNSSNRNGNLDIDMNGGTSTTREAVENVIFADKSKMIEGQYTVIVNNFRRAETIDVGFNVEVECNDEISTFSYNKAVSAGANIEVCKFTYTKNDGVSNIISTLDGDSVAGKQKLFFGVPTMQFHKVSAIIPSPNYWDDNGRGNKHTFFILEDAKNEDAPRGFFNEFLKPELTDHRKVFEVLGSKLLVKPAEKQLSGIGFSSTMHGDFICRVSGESEKIMKVKF